MSKALTRGRESLGEFENYGERLYVEGLMEIDRRRREVREMQSWASENQGVSPVAGTDAGLVADTVACNCGSRVDANLTREVWNRHKRSKVFVGC